MLTRPGRGLRCEVVSKSLIDHWFAHFTPESMRSVRNRASAATWFLQTVYDLIAKICLQNAPVYDLTAIDTDHQKTKFDVTFHDI